MCGSRLSNRTLLTSNSNLSNSNKKDITMYREWIERLTEGNRWAGVREACSEADIRRAEEYVGFSFPEELKALLSETDGDGWFLLSAARIIEHARLNREIYPEYLEPDEFEEKVNRFVYFATNGCGDYYCYSVLPSGETDDTAICIWEH